MIRWGVLKPPLSIIVYSLRMERLALNDVRITRRSSECWNVKVFDDLILWNRNSSHLFLTWSFVTSHSCLSTVSSQCHDVVSLFSPCVKQKYNRTEPGKARELFLSLFFFLLLLFLWPIWNGNKLFIVPIWNSTPCTFDPESNMSIRAIGQMLSTASDVWLMNESFLLTYKWKSLKKV